MSTRAIEAGRAVVRASLDDAQMARGLKRAQARLKRFGASVGALGARMAKFGLLLAAPFAASAKIFADFSDQMSTVQAVMGATTQQMQRMTEVAKEFNYKISTFHHATEAYKIADILADNGICTATWSDDWGSKHEVFDMVLENIALLEHAGACAIVHSDSARIIQHLNQEAAKSMTAGNQLGFNIDEAQAITWITLNAAQAIGIDKQTGSVEVGKNADLVLWDGNPFSIYSKAEKVYIDGALVYDRLDPAKQPVSDIILGMVSPLLPEAGESK